MNVTEFWMKQIISDVIREELEELATNFEDGWSDGSWTGRQIAEALRERIKNHPAVTPADGQKS